MANRIQIRRDTAANWTSYNPTLAQGEIGVVTDAVPVQMKLGDGSTAWASLPYIATGSMTVAGSTLDNLVDGSTYKRVVASIATALNAGTYSIDSLAEGTTYKRIVAAAATALNAVNPTQAGITDANAIAAASGATLAARIAGLNNTAKGVSGVVACTSGVATTLTSFAAGSDSAPPVVYIVMAGTPARNIATCAVVGIVTVLFTAAVYTSLKTATGATLSMSGLDLQITETTGNENYWYAAMRVY